MYIKEDNAMCLGLGNGCVVKEKKRTSLLKPYTNFENLKAMNINELAEKLVIVELNAAMVFDIGSPEEFSSLKQERQKDWIEWLESEAE